MSSIKQNGRFCPLNKPASLRKACAAAHEILVGREDVDPGRTAAFGYCFGAQALLEYARTGTDLAAIVGFHPGLGTNRPEEARSIRSSLLMFVGADDPITPRVRRNAFEDEMSAAGVPWRMVVYSGVAHAFTNPSVDERGMPGFAYDRSADTDSWNTALAFIETAFWQKRGPSLIKSDASK
jgi:dienelactone hydrolase